MKQELFDPQAFAESSSRIIYTPSTFARTSLLHLQEAGSFQAVYPHTSKRSDLVSCLCFVVLSGTGELKYEGKVYKLSAGDCVFIDCRKAYSHSTGYLCDEKNDPDLWSLQWCHFYGAALLTVLMEQSGHSEEGTERGKRLELSSIKAYLDEHYAEKIVL